jgi:alanine racemase
LSRTIAEIDKDALCHNLQQIRCLLNGARISAVVKDNAYGHGISNLLGLVEELSDSVSVSTIEEGVELRQLGYAKEIWILTGFTSSQELEQIYTHRLIPVVHCLHQVNLIMASNPLCSIIVKIDTGMGRLGFSVASIGNELREVFGKGNVKLVMSHFSRAEETENDMFEHQLSSFQRSTDHLKCPRSIANSAALIRSSEAHLDWVRPGIMLYGVSPFPGSVGSDLGLKPVMTLKSKLISVRTMKAGDTIGYGSEWVCSNDMTIGIVGCGYGDGYPRSLATGSNVHIHGSSAPVIGRVSMDSLAIDLTHLPDSAIGESVVLWGPELPIEKIAALAGTIPNDLFCRISSRVQRCVT